MQPDRIRLSRQKGWRMPENTAKVTRPGPLGNPFITGTHGTRLECAGFYTFMIDGKFVLGRGVSIETQLASYNAIREHADRLRGQNLACFCTLPAPGQFDPCHARVALEFINQFPRAGSHTDRLMHAWQATKRRSDLFVGVETVTSRPKHEAA